MAGEMATTAGGTHPTGMYSCSNLLLLHKIYVHVVGNEHFKICIGKTSIF